MYCTLCWDYFVNIRFSEVSFCCGLRGELELCYRLETLYPPHPPRACRGRLETVRSLVDWLYSVCQTNQMLWRAGQCSHEWTQSRESRIEDTLRAKRLQNWLWNYFVRNWVACHYVPLSLLLLKICLASSISVCGRPFPLKWLPPPKRLLIITLFPFSYVFPIYFLRRCLISHGGLSAAGCCFAWSSVCVNVCLYAWVALLLSLK